MTVTMINSWYILDFDSNSPELIQNSKDLFVASMKNTTNSQVMYITLNHDIRLQTAYNLTDFMLNYLVTNDFPKSVTVGECLDDPVENWYRKTPTGPDPVFDAPTSSATSGSTPTDSASSGSSISPTSKSDSSKLPMSTGLFLPRFTTLLLLLWSL